MVVGSLASSSMRVNTEEYSWVVEVMSLLQPCMVVGSLSISWLSPLLPLIPMPLTHILPIFELNLYLRRCLTGIYSPLQNRNLAEREGTQGSTNPDFHGNSQQECQTRMGFWSLSSFSFLRINLGLLILPTNN